MINGVKITRVSLIFQKDKSTARIRSHRLSGIQVMVDQDRSVKHVLRLLTCSLSMETEAGILSTACMVDDT